MKNKVTMQQTIFYLLLKKFKAGDHGYIPVHAFMGEHRIEELDTWGYVSYEVSARLSEIGTQNPGLLGRSLTTGKSGSKYYEYRISPTAKAATHLKDPALIAFYERLTKKKLEKTDVQKMVEQSRENIKRFDAMPDKL